jgi:hypothetical protein
MQVSCRWCWTLMPIRSAAGPIGPTSSYLFWYLPTIRRRGKHSSPIFGPTGKALLPIFGPTGKALLSIFGRIRNVIDRIELQVGVYKIRCRFH